MLLTLPMRGRGSSNHCVCLCICVSVTALVSATNALKAKVRYQQKALDAGNIINIGIELKSLGCAGIESVDSNVGIARTRNIWQYIKISPNLNNGELILLYDNILFIFECFNDQQDSQWHERALRKYPTKQQQNGQIVFLLLLLLLLSSDRLAQYCVNLSRWFMHETAAFSTEQCMTPSPFHNFEVSQGARSRSLKHYGFQFGTPFSLFVLTHVHLKVT